MIALYKYILEVNAKEEEELFQLKDNADTKANGHHKPGMQKPRWEVRSMSGIAAGRLRAGGSGSSQEGCVAVTACASRLGTAAMGLPGPAGDTCPSLFGAMLGRRPSRSKAPTCLDPGGSASSRSCLANQASLTAGSPCQPPGPSALAQTMWQQGLSPAPHSLALREMPGAGTVVGRPPRATLALLAGLF